MCCTRRNVHSPHYALCRHFTAFAELFSFLFLVVSFRDSLTLEEPVKLSKVAWCVELPVERLTGIKPTLGCSGKAEG